MDARQGRWPPRVIGYEGGSRMTKRFLFGTALRRTSRPRRRGLRVWSLFFLPWLLLVGLMLPQTAWPLWEAPPQVVDHRGFVSSWLSYLDARTTTGERYKRFRVPVRAGERLRILVVSPHFSPVIELHGDEEAASPAPDARGGATYDAAHDGVVEIFVRGAERGEMGVFRLQVVRTTAAEDDAGTSVRHPRLRAGHSVQGTLAERETSGTSADSVAHYPYLGRAGEHIRVRARAQGFRPSVRLTGHGLSSGSGGVSNGHEEAVLDVILPVDGLYTVSVFDEEASTAGAYVLTLTRVAQEGAVRDAQLEVGQSIVGRLEPGDLNRSYGQWVDRYLLPLAAGDEVSVELRSADFDANLYVVFPDQGGEESDDLSESSTDARVLFRAPVTGDYEVFATSYRRGETGRYQLEVAAATIGGAGSEPPSDARSRPRYPDAEASQSAVLEASARRMSDGSYYDAYTLRAEAGQEWTVELRSDAFDTHLELRGDEGLSLSNDDATTRTTDSLLTFKTGQAEVLTIYVTSHVPEATGAYELRVYRGGPKNPARYVESPAARYGRVIALSIGITEYGSDRVADLPYCAEDAVKVQTALAHTGMLAPESITLLNARATRAAVYDAFAQLSQVVGPNDVFFLFYSGHGGQVPSDDPAELDGLDETLVLAGGEEMIRDKELADLVMTVEPRLTIVALDACYSGGFRSELRSRKNQIGIFSSEEDVASLVAEEFKAGGYLAHIIARALSEDADRYPRDGAVTVDELLQYIRREWADAGRVPSQDSLMRHAHQHLVIERGHTQSQEVVLTRPPSLR